jgi:hypothetical protein
LEAESVTVPAKKREESEHDVLKGIGEMQIQWVELRSRKFESRKNFVGAAQEVSGRGIIIMIDKYIASEAMPFPFISPCSYLHWWKSVLNRQHCYCIIIVIYTSTLSE